MSYEEKQHNNKFNNRITKRWSPKFYIHYHIEFPFFSVSNLARPYHRCLADPIRVSVGDECTLADKF